MKTELNEDDELSNDPDVISLRRRSPDAGTS